MFAAIRPLLKLAPANLKSKQTIRDEPMSGGGPTNPYRACRFHVRGQ